MSLIEVEPDECAISPGEKARLETLVQRITATEDGDRDSMYWLLSALLTSVSLNLAPDDATQILIFVPNSENKVAFPTYWGYDKPALIAFYDKRDVAQAVAHEHAYEQLQDQSYNEQPQTIKHPSVHFIRCVVEFKDLRDARDASDFLDYDDYVDYLAYNDDYDAFQPCTRYTSLISRYDPTSSVAFGLLANRKGLRIYSLGLEEAKGSDAMFWEDDHSVEKLYSCVRKILDNARKEVPETVPRIIPDSAFNAEEEGKEVQLYEATIGQTTYTLLPIYYGRSDRKPFVAIAVPSTSVADDGDRDEQDKPDTTRIFKYSWYEKTHHRREFELLKKLRGVPGVVQIDESLYLDSVSVDEWSGRTRSLLAMKTIGYPLCSCESVLEFLEAMYDLLEVLRYLVQEKEVLHRDISWRNVLIRPKHPPDVQFDTPVRQTNEPIPHTYRFISDIFREEKHRIRVALTDFDCASDLSNASEEELREATGTPMFMAQDVLEPRDIQFFRLGRTLIAPETMVETSQEAAAEARHKYSDDSERTAWDAFYSGLLSNIEYIDSDDPKVLFKHGAMHDAESVFYLCFLFFNRLKRAGAGDVVSSDILQERQWGRAFEKLTKRSPYTLVFVSFREGVEAGIDPDFMHLMNAMNNYLYVPWYTVKSTSRKERYEFHLHDYMQRLLLNEIRKLREQPGADPIAISDRPRRVRTTTGNHSFSSHSRVLASTLNTSGHTENETERENSPTATEGSEDEQAIVCINGSNIPSLDFIARRVKPHLVFNSSHLTLLKYKERERLWTSADAYA